MRVDGVVIGWVKKQLFEQSIYVSERHLHNQNILSQDASIVCLKIDKPLEANNFHYYIKKYTVTLTTFY